MCPLSGLSVNWLIRIDLEQNALHLYKIPYSLDSCFSTLFKSKFWSIIMPKYFVLYIRHNFTFL